MSTSETNPVASPAFRDHNRLVIEIGRRRTSAEGWTEQGRLARTAAFLRGHAGLVPRGVYRFTSFEEADAWMTRTMAETHERLSRKTSSASAER